MAARHDSEITMGNWADLPPDQRPQHARGPTAPNLTYATTGPVQYAAQGNYSYTAAPSSQAAPLRNPAAAAAGGFQYATSPGNITYTAKPVVGSSKPPPVRHTTQPTTPAYPAPVQPQYTAMPQAPPPPPAASAPPATYPPPPMGLHSPTPEHRAPSQSIPTTTHDGRKVVEMVPGGGGRMNAPPSPGGMRPHSLSVNGNRPDGLRMDRLSISGNRPDLQTLMPGGFSAGGNLPPPSPLLEAYHGTYQSISPMPQAMMMDDDLDHLPPLDSLSPRASSQSFHGRDHAHSSSRRSPSPPRKPRGKDKLALEAAGYSGSAAFGAAAAGYNAAGGFGRKDRDRDPPEKEKRRARIYDAEDDALALVDAMAQRTLDPDPLIDILPALSHDQMLELRAEYKRHCKVQGRGINIAKHIKLKSSGNFGKVAYVTALGKFEAEGYWANYWYQSNSARRELLIEALMGRSNHEMREIKDAFRDKRYGDSLTKCMDKELKADKFRKAVLMALEAERQEESDMWPPEYRARDADTLYKAIRAKEGGESTMLGVVIMRSDAHLREVLRMYERKYQGNFAREALRKSNNLVVSTYLAPRPFPISQRGLAR